MGTVPPYVMRWMRLQVALEAGTAASTLQVQ